MNVDLNIAEMELLQDCLKKMDNDREKEIIKLFGVRKEKRKLFDESYKISFNRWCLEGRIHSLQNKLRLIRETSEDKFNEELRR